MPAAGTDGRRDATGAASDGRPPTGRRGSTTAPPPRRRSGAPLLAGLAALILLAVVGAIALASRGDGGETPAPRAESTPSAEPTANATEEATPEPSDGDRGARAVADTLAAADRGGAERRARPRRGTGAPVRGLQRPPGRRYETALAKARAAQQACGNSKERSPCGYALFEEGAALNALGQPEAAIPILERRLAEYGDNESGAVKRDCATRARRPAARTADAQGFAPARRCKARMAVPALAPSTPALSVKPRLLCVDDEPIVLESLRDVLRRSFDVRVTTSGPEALAMLRREPRGYAVVLSDMRMPACRARCSCARRAAARRPPCGCC